MEFKSNSFAARQPQEIEKEKKNLNKISGKATTIKKSGFSKFVDNLIQGDWESTKKYIWQDVLLPNIKSTLDDILSKGIRRMIYGENDAKSSSNSSGYTFIGRPTAYSSFFGQQWGDSKSQSLKPENPILSLDSIILLSEADAKIAIRELKDLIETTGQAKVSELCEITRLPSEHTYENYGWKSLPLEDKAYYTAISGGKYKLKLPRPRPLS